ncbi:MAG TPA: aspartate/glutamate racemase family protein [Xanthobacteraceae bacterium]|nr:aspartate/glutamate racemase family protein [Xanthobacteraceae bacterium]
MADKPVIGLVVPHAQDITPPEGPIMYPDVTFIPHRTGVASLTPEGYDAAVDKVIPAAENLASRGVDAVMVVGTSLTFYRGPEFHEQLLEKLRAATGLPVSTMSQAIVDGLREVGAKRLAVSTAYSKVVNDKLAELLTFHGFEVGALESFGITQFGSGASAKSEADIIDLSVKADEQADGADAILISCGGLRTLNVAKPLEDLRGKPVVSSTPAAFWAAMRLVGQSGRVSGYGRMLENTGA